MSAGIWPPKAFVRNSGRYIFVSPGDKPRGEKIRRTLKLLKTLSGIIIANFLIAEKNGLSICQEDGDNRFQEKILKFLQEVSK